MKNSTKFKWLTINIIRFNFILCCSLLSSELFSQNNAFEADSVNQSQNNSERKMSVLQLFFSGITLQNQEKQKSWYLPSAFDFIQFNTVEGLVLNPSLSYTKYLKDKKFYNLKPNFRYGVNNRRAQVKLTTLYFYKPEKFASIELSGGRFVRQFNENSSLDAFGNSYNTLLFKRNFLKIFETTFLNTTHVFSPLKDFLLTNIISWEDREALQNLEKFNGLNSNFTSNNPESKELESTDFARHQIFSWRIKIKWQLDQRYERFRGKFISKSDRPAISLSLNTAFPNVFKSDLAYQKIALSLSDRYKLNLLGKGEFLLEVGDFISSKATSFIDFNHFNGNRILLSSFKLGNFQLLDYHEFSTSNFYLKSHLQHKFKTVSIGKGQRKVHPVLNVNYLYSESVNYFEFGIGVEQIFKVMRLDFYSSLKNGKHESVGLRFGYSMKN